MKKKTIIYIGGFELPDKNAAAHRVIANGKALSELGYNVVFIGVDNNEIDYKTGTKEVFFGFDCYRRKKAKSNPQWLKFLTDITPYKEIIQKYKDVFAIICYNSPALVLLNLKKVARKNSIKIFSDCTEWYDIKKKGNSLPKFLIRYLDVYFRMKIINSKLDGVIAISAYLFNFYKKKGAHTVQIPPLVDTTDEKWKNEFHQSSGEVQLLYAGTPFSLYKEPSYKDRIDVIIHSLYQLKKEDVSFQMHIIGINKAEVLDNFPELNVELEYLQNSLKFYGKLSHVDVIKILKSVDYSLFLRYNSKSVKAGFPTKFVESISCGIPVLTNRNSNIADYLTDGVTGFWISMENPKNMIASLKKALSANRQKIFEMKKNCYESKAFDYRKFVPVFQAFLSSR